MVELVTVKEAATVLKVSTVTIKRYVKRGLLPAYHVGPRGLRIKREDLERLLAPAGGREVTMKRERVKIGPPSPEELARRQAVGAKILAEREKRRIARMTTAELVHLAREESSWYGPSR